MLGASRISQQQVHERLDAVYDDPTQRPFLRDAGTGVLTVVDAAERERSLRVLWADTSTSHTVKDGVLAQVFGERVPQLSQQLVGDVIHQRWSNERDMIDALEEAGASLLFMAAEGDGTLDQVEEELFRFGRTLASNPELQMALTNPATSGDSKSSLVQDILQDKVSPITSELLVFAAGHLRGRRMLTAIESLSQLAAVRRNRLVAEVISAVPLTEEQKDRLGQVLSRIQGRDVLVNVTVDPSVIGGIKVRVGDEVIDGSISNRIEQARRRLTS
jgi:F-type H+-transporting ATPase subunit delta